MKVSDFLIADLVDASGYSLTAVNNAWTCVEPPRTGRFAPATHRKIEILHQTLDALEDEK